MAHSSLLLQLIVILGCARVLGLLLQRFGQPMVIGEMIAGLLLGPAVFGLISPALQAAVFPKASLPELDAVSQLGLVLFMFIVGAELRLPKGAASHIKSAVYVAMASVIVPMTLGFALAVPLHSRLSPRGVAFLPFALFLAVAMSITAFPVMARILKDRAETNTPIGRLALTSAAIADALCWIMLAAVMVLAGSGNSWPRVLQMFAGLTLLCTILFAAARPLITWFLDQYSIESGPTGSLLAALLIGTFASAYATSYLGVHPVFGAFLFGACLPRDDRLLRILIERIEHVALLVLIPIFFVLAGLNTSADAFTGGGGINLVTVLVVAIVGKLAGGTIGARISGMAWRPALAIGSLMNARGLLELIVMKVGFDAGIIGKSLFTLLLAMAIVTTLMTGPLLNLLVRKPRLTPPILGVS